MSATLILAQTIHFIGECPETAGCDYVHKTMGLLSDAPHVTSEFVVDAVTWIITAIIFWALGKKSMSKRVAKLERNWERKMKEEHERIDTEHGVADHGGQK